MQDENDKEMEVEGTGITNEIPPEDPDFDEFDDDDEEDEELTIVEKIIGVFTSPSKTFAYISEHPDFWWPLIIISLIMIGASVLVMPKMMPLIQDTMVESIRGNPGMDEATKDAAVEQMVPYIPAIAYGQLGFIPIMMGFSWLFSALIVFLTGLGQGLQVEFKKLMGVIPWLGFISMLSETAKSIYLFSLKELPDGIITNPGLAKPFSAAALVAGNPDTPSWLGVFLSAIDPFTIWATIVMVTALQHANKCTRNQAIVTVVVTTIIGLLILTGLGSMQGAGVQVNASS